MTTVPTGFIDPPSVFAPTYEWRAFVEELKKMPQSDDRDVELAAAEVHLQSIEDEESDGDEDDFSDLE